MASSYPEPGSAYSAPLTEALTRHADERVISVPFRFDTDGYVAVASGRGNIIRQEILTLILTFLGERLMMPAYGSNLASLVWDNNSGRRIDVAIGEIRELVQTNFSGVSIVQLAGIPTGEVGEEMQIQLDYTYKNDPYYVSVNLTDVFPKDF